MNLTEHEECSVRDKAEPPQEKRLSRRVYGLVAGFASAGLVVVFLTGLLFNSTSITSNG